LDAARVPVAAGGRQHRHDGERHEQRERDGQWAGTGLEGRDAFDSPGAPGRRPQRRGDDGHGDDDARARDREERPGRQRRRCGTAAERVPCGGAGDRERDDRDRSGEDCARKLAAKLDDGLRYSVVEAISAKRAIRASFIARTRSSIPRGCRGLRVRRDGPGWRLAMIGAAR
jgi:hypothetical protein